MLPSQSYYASLKTIGNNVNRADVTLTVNCAGVTNEPFFFDNLHEYGRKDFHFIYMLNGKLDIWTESEKKVLVPGQMILYYPNRMYHYSLHGEETVQYFWMHFSGADAKRIVETCGFEHAEINNVNNGNFIELQFQNLLNDFITRDQYFEISLYSRAMSILVETARQVKAARVNWTDDRIVEAITYIHRHFAEDISMKALAENAHLSESRFRTLFKEKMGVSPKEYLIILRMNRAKELLLRTNLSVNQAAEYVGYTDQMYFSRLFSQREGMSPSDYRKPSHRDTK